MVYPSDSMALTGDSCTQLWPDVVIRHAAIKPWTVRRRIVQRMQKGTNGYLYMTIDGNRDLYASMARVMYHNMRIIATDISLGTRVLIRVSKAGAAGDDPRRISVFVMSYQLLS